MADGWWDESINKRDASGEGVDPVTPSRPLGPHRLRYGGMRTSRLRERCPRKNRLCPRHERTSKHEASEPVRAAGGSGTSYEMIERPPTHVLPPL